MPGWPGVRVVCLCQPAARAEAGPTGSPHSTPMPGGRNVDERRAPQLSAQEQRALELAAAGCTNRQIASAMSLSEATIKSYLKHAYLKLGANGRAHAVAKWLDARDNPRT
ncbi:MAG: LuxR family transcriptional regulator [Chloroflexi bacterium CFX7]|nr:LuxR family transcriptional regulator [Chloroflexi bacterium CFX7]RIL03645.1 MAG: hypothetical protein DCC78_02510 [bacterium]